MVMEEMDSPRQMYVYDRGEYDAPTEKVSAQTPSFLTPMDESLPKNRWGLAKWMFADNNSLTARVLMNRYWQLVFGEGLVKTTNDFGNQGSLPTHPELLDWLAVEFRERGWDLKHMLKTMVLSATYQQSSNFREDLKNTDPQNTLLARTHSYRMPGEMIRDNALMSSGLLYQKVGGESVKPYQPDGLWAEKSAFSAFLQKYEQDTDENQYRRSLYTFHRRTSPPPAMTAFDVPNRSNCTVKREVTNIPLQALVLLNDPQFVETCKALSVRVQGEEDTVERQLEKVFQHLLGRAPESQEFSLLEQLYEEEYQKYSKDQQAGKALLSVGNYEVDLATYDLSQTAALTAVANVIINQDEFYMKR